MNLKTKYGPSLIFLLSCCNLFSQNSASVDNYHYFTKKEGYSWSPAFHFFSPKNGYTSVRYNYEESATFSAITGKSFKKGNTIKSVLTPAAGIAAGQYNGLILALNTQVSFGLLEFYSQGQYSVGLGKEAFNSYYSWSDLSCKLADWISAGFALQQRIPRNTTLVSDPGVFAALHFGQWNFPLYYFTGEGQQNTIVAGVNLEWEIKKIK